MVHIPLPGLPHRNKSSLGKSKESNGSAAGPDNPQTSSTRHGSTGSALGVDSEKPLILKVYVIKARNLAAKDKSGTSDPFLVCTLGTSRQSTPTINKNLNPEWKITFDMPLTGVPLLECTCWDKDRFSRDYMGEFDIAVEEMFHDGQIQSEPQWYKLKSKRTSKKKDGQVSGEVQMQFTLVDSGNPAASPDEISRKFKRIIQAEAEEEDDSLSKTSTLDDEDFHEPDDMDDDMSGKTADERRAKQKNLARLRRKSIAAQAYDLKSSGLSGVVFLELLRVTDLPPERNVTRTSFDMDPFVVIALGRKILRSKVIRHNLNPVYNEKMIYQVLKHETGYSLTFTVIDQDKLSGNDFVASASFPISTLIDEAPERDPMTGLYNLPEIPEYSPSANQPQAKSKFRIPLSRKSSATAINKLSKPGLKRDESSASITGLSPPDSGLKSAPSGENGSSGQLKLPQTEDPQYHVLEENSIKAYTIPLELKNKARWEDKHKPELFIKGRFLPYPALRQQFWRAMLRQYDADESGRVSKVEFTTMLDTLGSTLKESTINSFFARFAAENDSIGETDMSFDQCVICLEDQLEKSKHRQGDADESGFESNENIMSDQHYDSGPAPIAETSTQVATNEDPTRSAIPVLERTSTHTSGMDNLADDSGDEEHVIEIRECPICHQPKLNLRTDSDIITHIAICASQDWRQVNNLVMGGFVTQSQAQRKWYSKIVNKISYGGYKLGANSANILVQDRITGQINEERMSVYVRLGIRLLYKAMGSREMEKKRIKNMLKSLSIKQGKKYDDPASASQIEGFIAFHQLNMAEVLLPTDQFKNFNEFFYRKLKPDARPCSAPDQPEIIVSPADSRTVVFNTIDDATRIWVKGRDYTLERLFGDAYPLEAKRFKGGSMGIFRLAPQDYHRFHVPVDGVLGTPKPIDGEYYTVNPMAIRSALDVYGENIRVVIPIDTVAHGRMMFVCIGAMMVGSTVITRKAGETVKRAEELGYFKFGGSTVLMFFEPGKMVYDDDLVENSNGALETLVRVGMSVGHSPHVDAHHPDMKKDASKVTMEERQEAKRRIEGSLAPEPDSDGNATPNLKGGSLNPANIH